MSDGEDHGWDFLSGSEAEAVDGARDELRGQAWAQPLVRAIPATADLTRADKARLFELRFARVLYRAGIVPRYEIAGVDARNCAGQPQIDAPDRARGEAPDDDHLRGIQKEVAERLRLKPSG